MDFNQMSPGIKEEKDVREHINCDADLCDLCKLGERIRAEMWPGFFRS